MSQDELKIYSERTRECRKINGPSTRTIRDVRTIQHGGVASRYSSTVPEVAHHLDCVRRRSPQGPKLANGCYLSNFLHRVERPGSATAEAGTMSIVILSGRGLAASGSA